MKKPKKGKTRMITFLTGIQDSKTVLKYGIRQNLRKFHRSLFWSDFIFKAIFGILNIKTKKISLSFFRFRHFSCSILKLPSITVKLPSYVLVKVLTLTFGWLLGSKQLSENTPEKLRQSENTPEKLRKLEIFLQDLSTQNGAINILDRVSLLLLDR